MRRAFMVVTAFLLWSIAPAFALTTTNLSSIEKADAFARAIVAHYEAEAAKKKVPPSELDPIVIVHLGSEPPKPLEWVMVHLAAKGIPLEFKLITEKEMRVELDAAKERALNDEHYLTFDRINGARKQGIAEIWPKAHLGLKRLFGFPYGLTAWMKVQRTKALKRLEAGAGAVSAVLAGSSVAFTLYLSESPTNHPSEISAALAVSGLVFVYSYQARRLAELMTLSKAVKQTGPGEFEAKNGVLFKTGANVIRSLFTNAVVFAAAFGVESLFSTYNLQQSLVNTSVNLFARSWVDDWFGKRLPTIRHDGSIEVDRDKGQWGFKTWFAANALWSLVYQFGKNMHLLGFGSEIGTNAVFYSMGGIGLIKLGMSQWHDMKRRLRRTYRAIFRAKSEACETLILGRR